MMYKAEFKNEEMEIFEAESHEEAMEEAWNMSESNNNLFALYLIDEDYEVIKCIL